MGDSLPAEEGLMVLPAPVTFLARLLGGSLRFLGSQTTLDPVHRGGSIKRAISVDTCAASTGAASEGAAGAATGAACCVAFEAMAWLAVCAAEAAPLPCCGGGGAVLL